jgi:hypothetical protein
MGGQMYDAPNQEVVGVGPPWVEGDGGGAEVEPTETGQPENPLDAMTKDELLAEAQRMGLSPANAAMTKDELRAAIEAA